MAQVQEITLAVPDMSCGGCVNSINNALGNLKGVEEVKADLPTKTVHLRFQPEQVSLAQIETTLDDAGYTVTK